MKNRTRWVLAALAGALLLGLGLLWQLTPLREWLTFERLVQMDSQIKLWLVDNFLMGCLLYVAAYILASSFSLPGVSILSFSGGFLFGPWLNPVLINIGATTGAVILFGLARTTLGEGLRTRFEAKLAPVYQETEAHGAAYLLSMRFLPAIPFFLVNLIGGLGGFRFRTFLWTTSLGILPGSIVNSLIGWSAGEVLENPGPLPWPVYVAMGSLAALSLSTIAFRWYRKASMRPSQSAPRPPER